MNTIADKFVDYLNKIIQKGFSGETIDKAREHLADYLAVTHGGYNVNRKNVEEFIKDSPGSFSVIGCNRQADINASILINAFNAHTLELDDGHRNAMMHLAAPIFSGLLAVAEREQATVGDLLKGAIVGYEAAIRLGISVQPSHKKKGFHATGTCGTVGTAMGIAAMLGYDRTEMKNVLSAAATSASGLLEAITGQSEQKPYNVAQAALSGVNAALFGKYFCGPDDVLGGARGFVNCFSDESAQEELFKPQDRLSIWGTYMKPYAACRHCHAPIEAALNLRAEQVFEIADVDTIVVTTYDLAVYGHDHCVIAGVGDAKMSIPYSVAAALLYQSAGPDVFAEDKLGNPQVCELANKVKVISSDELSAVVKKKRVAIVAIHLQDGRILENRVDYPKGEPENPICRSELESKFISLITFSGCSEQYCRNILEFVNKADRSKVNELLSIMRG